MCCKITLHINMIQLLNQFEGDNSVVWLEHVRLIAIHLIAINCYMNTYIQFSREEIRNSVYLHVNILMFKICKFLCAVCFGCLFRLFVFCVFLLFCFLCFSVILFLFLVLFCLVLPSLVSFIFSSLLCAHFCFVLVLFRGKNKHKK